MPTPRKSKPRQRSGDYRIFIGAFPDGDLADQIQSIRQQYDPQTAVITPPHVTLAGTYWRNGSPTAANEAELIDRLEGMTGKVNGPPPKVVALSVAPRRCAVTHLIE